MLSSFDRSARLARRSYSSATRKSLAFFLVTVAKFLGFRACYLGAAVPVFGVQKGTHGDDFPMMLPGATCRRGTADPGRFENQTF
jgi:hypothetical protein